MVTLCMAPHTQVGLELRIDGEAVAACESRRGSTIDPLLNVNQISNSDLSGGLKHWEVAADSQTSGLKIGLDFNDDWTIRNIPTGFLRTKDASRRVELIYSDPVEGEFIPV